MKKIVPVNEQVLIKRIPPKEGIIALPDAYQKSGYAIGEVLAVGPGVVGHDAAPCAAQDVVIFWLGKDQKSEDNPVHMVEGYGDCILVPFDSIFAKVE